MDLIFILKMMLEKCWEWDIPKAIMFIDMEKAFNQVSREGLWNILNQEEYRVTPKSRKAVKSIYI